jgi:hypothetical protein
MSMSTNMRTVRQEDSYVTKIAKYVPAESIALATGFFAAFSPTGWWVPFWLVVFALANFGYLFGTAHMNDGRVTTDPHYYVLATCAFFAWSLATIDRAAEWAGLDGSASDPQRAWVLGVATGVIPMLDSLTKKMWPPEYSLSPKRRAASKALHESSPPGHQHPAL